MPTAIAETLGGVQKSAQLGGAPDFPEIGRAVSRRRKWEDPDGVVSDPLVRSHIRSPVDQEYRIRNGPQSLPNGMSDDTRMNNALEDMGIEERMELDRLDFFSGSETWRTGRSFTSGRVTTPELESIVVKLDEESRENKRARGLSPTEPNVESAYAAPASASYRASEAPPWRRVQISRQAVPSTYCALFARRSASVARARTVFFASTRAWFLSPATRLVMGTQRFV